MATLSVRLDDKTHNAFLEFCDTVGLSASTAFNLFAKAVVREQKIPFEIKVDSFYSNENVSHILDADKRIDEGKYIITDMNLNVASPEVEN
ncbi:MAG: type II toxin-antitoxin system RelB/DinJ family antitoxin [Spirochaetales bacterium]|uniref:type II toxin-antitoxin system RelB/DinJ family antitoxin n=1 Tax=Treponema sp. TaxID=166 RepID=UPI0027100E27|nr:type II toxin-antitoxin system RelB/DinJ family antitoxin [Spirochaetales bacterium]